MTESETYSPKTWCMNCHSHFVYDPETPPDFRGSRGMDRLNIKKGTRICDVKCPICGCKTLIAAE